MGNKECCKRYYEKHKQEQLKRMRDRILDIKALKKECLGSTCFLCGTTEGRILLHEINGQNHNIDYNFYYRYLKNPNQYEFVPLCFKHHKMLHEVIKFFQLTPEKRKPIMELVNLALGKSLISLKNE